MNKNTIGRHIWCTEAHVHLADSIKIFSYYSNQLPTCRRQLPNNKTCLERPCIKF